MKSSVTVSNNISSHYILDGAQKLYAITFKFKETQNNSFLLKLDECQGGKNKTNINKDGQD